MFLLFSLGGFSWGEWGVVCLLALLVFGGKRLPEFARNWGRGLRALQRGWNEVKEELTDKTESGDHR